MPDPTHQYLRFALGQGRYTIDLARVKEILEFGPLTPVPMVPAFVRGVMNLRGAVVPVIDLGDRLGLGAASIGRRSCIVMVDLAVETRDELPAMGVLVDAVDEVVDADEAHHEPVPPLGTEVDPRFLRSLVRVRGVATPELDLSTVLDPAALAHLMAAGSTRR
ncbi:chemotaxis protein CheW [uncultured Sphaerotilus sp.]|uniref:chemotaxis protein CheW n=1 Tax=uncultured Sphaerotilus sp. TaxID=474984 RepID=UPI0030CA5921